MRPGRPSKLTPEIKELLGRVPDKEIADRVGCATHTVWKWRTDHGIPSTKRKSRQLTIPDAVSSLEKNHPGMCRMLGMYRDSVIAKKHGMSKQRVEQHRKRLGIHSLQDLQIDRAMEFMELHGDVPNATIMALFPISINQIDRIRDALQCPNSRCADLRDARYSSIRDRLGKQSDYSLADEAGIHFQTVARLRKRLGIPAFGRGEE